MYKIQKKVSQGKILVFFLQDTINFFFQKSGYFLAKSGHYFSILKIGQGRPPRFLPGDFGGYFCYQIKIADIMYAVLSKLLQDNF